MSRLKKLSLIFLLSVVLLLGAVAGILGTQTGLHWLLNSATRWVSGLSIADIRGNWRDLQLTQLRYVDEKAGLDVEVAKIDFGMAPACLLKSKLCMTRLAVQGMTLTLPNAPVQESAPSDNTPLSLSLPYPIEITQLDLQDWTVQAAGVQVVLGSLQSGLSWRGKALTLQPTHLKTLQVVFPPSSPTTSVSDSTHRAPQQAVPTLQAQISEWVKRPPLAEMQTMKLPLNIQASRIVTEDIEIMGVEQITISKGELSLLSQDHHFALQKLHLTTSLGTFALQGKADLTDDWPLYFELQAEGKNDKLGNPRLHLVLDGALREQTRLAVQWAGNSKLQLEATARLAESGIPLNLSANSPQLSWQTDEHQLYQLHDSTLQVSGKLNDYAMSVHSTAKGTQLPVSNMSLQGKGTLTQFELATLKLHTLQGEAELAGTVDWQEALQWQARLTLSELDSRKQWPEWPARLSGQVESRGKIGDGQWQFEMPVLDLSGQVQHYPLKVEGSLKGDSTGHWMLPMFRAEVGKNYLNAKGELANQWNLDAQIDAPNLSGVLPGAAGRLQGELQLRGSREHPQLVTQMQAHQLRWQDLQIGSGDLKGNVQVLDQIKGELTVLLTEIRQGEWQAERLDLTAKGNEKDHRLQLSLKGEPFGGQLSLEGHYARAQGKWLGSVSQTHFSTPFGEWQLGQMLSMQYQTANQQLEIGRHCWQNPQAEICVPTRLLLGKSGQADVQLVRFNPELIRSLLPIETELTGNFTGRAHLAWSPEHLTQADLSLVGENVRIQQGLQNKTLPVELEQLSLESTLARGNANLTWRVGVKNNGQLSGQMKIADPMGLRQLSGSISMENFSLAILSPLLIPGEKLEGMLNADLQMGGRLSHPALSGRFSANHLHVESKLLPFDITQGDLSVTFERFRSVLEGVIRTPLGQLNLSGEGDWQTASAWQATVRAKGEKIRVTIPPIVRTDLSPDVELRANSQGLALNGRVRIPWARIQVQELPENAVSVSADEVMLDEYLQPIEKHASAFPITTHLLLELGEDVRLSAFGLKTGLKGNLKVEQDAKGKGLGLNGRIELVSGRFHAYGQDLLIRKGGLLFTGSPEQPMLDIEAIRNPEATENNVTAGVRVTGVADAPRLDIFSDPAMSQQEALSYLLRGQGLETQTDDSAMMTSMLIGLGVAKSGKLVGKIGEAFGVSNLSLDTQGVGDKSQVVVSGYVLPGLQVKYGVGIFDSLATLTLRYRLMPQLYLEAVSGVDQALDLLYQFEF